MTPVHGWKTALWIGTRDVSEHFASLEPGADVDAADVSTFKLRWKKYIEGMAASELQGSGFYDKTLYYAPGYNALIDDLAGDDHSVVTGCPGGDAFGEIAFLASTIETSLKTSSPIGGGVAFDVAYLVDGELAVGHVLLPMAERSVTDEWQYTATFDGGASAASALGGIWHIHLIDGAAGIIGTVEIVLEDASVPSGGGANWNPIDLLEYSGLESTVERLIFEGDVRRYLRVGWRELAADPPHDLTFGVAVARSTQHPTD